MLYPCNMKTSKGINAGPASCPCSINVKPSGGGRVGPATVYPSNPHPKAKSGGRTAKVSDAMKGRS